MAINITIALDWWWLLIVAQAIKRHTYHESTFLGRRGRTAPRRRRSQSTRHRLKGLFQPDSIKDPNVRNSGPQRHKLRRE